MAKHNDSPETIRTLSIAPDPSCRQILLASDNIKLIKALSEIAKQEQAQICLLRPNTPDIIFKGNIRIVDRHYLGYEWWEIFCDFIAEGTNNEDYPILDDNGEVIFEEPLYDKIPIIIIDNKTEEGLEFSYPEEARGEVLFIDQDSIDEILKNTARLLHDSQPIVSGARSVEKEDIKGKRLF